MAVIGGGISGFFERRMLWSILGNFDQWGTSPYVGLSATQPIDVRNFGSSVTYGASSLVDSQNYFPYNLAGAGVKAGSQTGTVQSNTLNTVTLTGAWTGGTPTAGSEYDIYLFSEPSGNNYSRVAITNDDIHFVSTPAAGSQVNYAGSLVLTGAAINFPAATGAGWGQIVSAFVADSPTRNLGNMVFAQPLATPQFVLGGQMISIPIGAFGLGLK
jgi:hypothetical protein